MMFDPKYRTIVIVDKDKMRMIKSFMTGTDDISKYDGQLEMSGKSVVSLRFNYEQKTEKPSELATGFENIKVKLIFVKDYITTPPLKIVCDYIINIYDGIILPILGYSFYHTYMIITPTKVLYLNAIQQTFGSSSGLTASKLNDHITRVQNIYSQANINTEFNKPYIPDDIKSGTGVAVTESRLEDSLQLNSWSY